MKTLLRVTSAIVMTSLLALSLNPAPAMAASLTSMSDTLSTETLGSLAYHTIQFVSPTGVGAGQTMTFSFSAAFGGVSNVTAADVDVAYGGPACTTFSTPLTLAASASGATWGVSAAGQVVTITSATGTIPASQCIQVKIGANATGGTNRITNPATTSTGYESLTVAGTMADSGILAIPFLSNDTVNVTATVDPTITFSISDNTIGFGSLSPSASRYATGNGAVSAALVTAHTLAAATNAQSGYVITVLGPTLTTGTNTITAIGATPAAPAVGTEQFGLSITDDGLGIGDATTMYDGTTGNFAYDGATSTPSPVAQSTGPSVTTTYNVRYLANIDATTQAGTYSTNLVYTATGTF